MCESYFKDSLGLSSDILLAVVGLSNQVKNRILAQFGIYLTENWCFIQSLPRTNTAIRGWVIDNWTFYPAVYRRAGIF